MFTSPGASSPPPGPQGVETRWWFFLLGFLYFTWWIWVPAAIAGLAYLIFGF